MVSTPHPQSLALGRPAVHICEAAERMARGVQAIFWGDPGGPASRRRGRIWARWRSVSPAGAGGPSGTRAARSGRIAAAAAGHMTAGSASAPPASPRSCGPSPPRAAASRAGERHRPARSLSRSRLRGAGARLPERGKPKPKRVVPLPRPPGRRTGARSLQPRSREPRAEPGPRAPQSRVFRPLQRRPLPPSRRVAGRRGPARERRAEWAGAASTRSGRCPCSCW